MSSCIYISNGPNCFMGGPRGYIANLAAGAVDAGIDLSIEYTFDQSNKGSSDTAKARPVSGLRQIMYYFKQGFKIKRADSGHLDKYEMVHVHDSIEAVYLRDFLRYKGSIVFTPHRPEPLWSEVGARCSRAKALSKAFYSWVEKRSYKVADAFIFPSLHSREIYAQFPGFSRYAGKKPIKYLITGAPEKAITKGRCEYRKQLGISDGRFVVCYIGRHNEVKGYDLLKDISSDLFDFGCVIVCAGGPEAYSEQGWIELGYISDPQNLMNAADLIVVPNRQTYFDLIIVEAMSQGSLIVTSKTGGNIDLADWSEGIVAYDGASQDDLLNAIRLCMTMSEDERASRRASSRLFYENNCTPAKFAIMYQQIISDLELSMTSSGAI